MLTQGLPKYFPFLHYTFKSSWDSFNVRDDINVDVPSLKAATVAFSDWQRNSDRFYTGALRFYFSERVDGASNVS